MSELSSTEITLVEAVERTTAWRDAFTKPTVNAFLVRLDDLQGIINEHRSLGAEYTRVYMTKVFDTDIREYVAGLAFVGAFPDEKDILPSQNDPISPISKIWDVAKPCPPTCGDDTSPLATGNL